MDDCPLGPGVDGGRRRGVVAETEERDARSSREGVGGRRRGVVAETEERDARSSREGVGGGTPGSGGEDGGEGRSILARGGWRETLGSGGGDGGEWEGDQCCNRIRFFSRNRAALSCLRRLLDHSLRPVSDMDLWMRQFNKEREETHFYHTFANEK